MKQLLVLTIAVLSINAHAEDSFYIVNNKKTDSKVEALKTLINDPNAQVFKCDAQELTKKATLKKK